jgi:hypothetical protein
VILDKIQIEYSGGVPGGRAVPAKEFHAYRREAWLAVGNYWHDHFRAKHFTKAGAREYGYQQRSGEGLSGKAFWKSYTGRKQKYRGHSDPLVYSGRSRERSQQRTLRAVSRGPRSYLQIRINAPALNFRRTVKGKLTPDMVSEMQTISKAEKTELVKVHDDTMHRLLQQRPYQVTVTIPAK